MFVNVLENAVTYANTGGQVTIESLSQNGAVLVRIANTGSELSQEEAEQAFARFWRGDSARRDTGLHCVWDSHWPSESRPCWRVHKSGVAGGWRVTIELTRRRID